MKHHWWQPFLIPFTALTYVLTLLILPFYRPSSIRFRDWAIELVDNTPNSRKTTIWGRPGGQSWGCRLLWFNMMAIRDGEEVNVHERAHAIQGELVNAVAHAVLVPAAWFIWGSTGAVVSGLIAQGAFGAAYGLHFLFEWARQGFGPWQSAYMRIWAERLAYRADDEYMAGQRPWAWGGEG